MANNNHFELTLDTLAPVGSISRGSTLAHNANFNLTIDKGDASFMYVWFDTSASTSEIPSGVTAIVQATSYETKFSEDGTYYYHLVLEDDLGNRSTVYHTDSIVYDTTLPVVTEGSVEICKRDGSAISITTTRDVAIKAAFSDNLSGCVSYTLSGEIVGEIAESSVAYQTGVAYEKDVLIHNNSVGYAVYEAITAEENTSFDAIKSKLILWASVYGNLTSEEISAGKFQKDIVLSGTGEEESTKIVHVMIKDAAGNWSAPKSDTIYLDTKFLTGAIILKDSTGAKEINDTWYNLADFKIELTASDKSDWKGYKVWGDFNTDGGSTGTTEPENFTDLTAEEIAAKKVVLSRKFTSGDAENKTVNAKIIDTSGNITTLTAVSADLDYTAPTKDGTAGSKPEIACNVTYVSLQTGFNQAVFTPTADYNISGAKQFQWYCNGSAWSQEKSGSGLGPAVALTVNASDLGEGGAKVAKTFTLKLTDNAGNEVTTDGVTVYLDTVAPAGTITMDAWYNRDDADHTTYSAFSGAGATASATDGGAGMAYMTCWCSQTANDTTVTGTQTAYAENPTHAQIDWTGKQESTTNYIHIEYVDAVGNKAIAHSAAFGIDLTSPGTGTITFTKEAYPDTSATVILGYSDGLSGMGAGSKFKVWGDITSAASESAATWEAIASSKAVTLSGEDGLKNIYVRYMDVAGNISGKVDGQPQADPATDSTELDRSTPSVTTSLLVSGTETAKPAISNVKESDFRFAPTDDQLGKIFYQVYGDFTINGTQSAQGLVEKTCTLYQEGTAYNANVLVLHEGAIYMTAAAINAADNTDWATFVTKTSAVVNTDYWKEFTPDSGQTYKTIATICTSGDATKNFYVKIMDNAGNQVAGTPRSFTYDTTAPEVVVSNVDHNRISKVHTKRLKDESGTISELTTYNDETKFTSTPDSDCQAYKVCAYLDQTAAKAGSHEDPAIPTTAGSTNMSATGIEFGPSKTTKVVNSMIKGADYETALGGTGKDGAHYVVVYVQDMGGTWSVAASFEA